MRTETIGFWSEAKLLREGNRDKDGVGAEVRIRAFGAVEFTPSGAGTDVRWTSRFEVPVPLVGWILGPAIRQVFGYIHQSSLLQAREMLETPVPGVAGDSTEQAKGGIIKVPDWIKKVLKIKGLRNTG